MTILRLEILQITSIILIFRYLKKVELNKTVKAAVFSATAIGLGFLFMLVPNVEFITVTVFLSGLTLGAVTGGFVGGSSIMIYSILNPLGSGLAYLPLLVGQIISMTGIGFFGALFGNILLKISSKPTIILSGLIGSFCSLWYDLITTVSFPLSAGYTFNEIIIYGISGLVFTFMHVLSNAIIFMVVIPRYKEKLHS